LGTYIWGVTFWEQTFWEQTLGNIHLGGDIWGADILGADLMEHTLESRNRAANIGERDILHITLQIVNILGTQLLLELVLEILSLWPGSTRPVY